MNWNVLDNFRLVGGTNLSLQLGHRQSIDIDLFTDIDFDINETANSLREKYPKADIRKTTFGITLYIKTLTDSELKIDLMQTDKFIRNIQIIENIRFAHIEDIAAMKLEAITSRNTKKDFYDISELLNFYSLEELLNFYSEKYPYNDIKQVLENITFFSEDCELDFEPKTFKDRDWLSVKYSITDAFNNYINQKIND
jgi:predicted nucleotidyltransferase component of viral defense system